MQKTLLKWLFLAFVYLSLAAAHADSLQEPELLEADQAFALTTRVIDANTIEASWKIAPDYYLYRDKFKFDVVSGDALLGPARFPAGKMKHDDNFGNVEIYTKSVKATLPIERHNAARMNLVLRITAQGCNDAVGVCYPPHTKDVTLVLPAGKAASVEKAPPAASAALPVTTDKNAALRSLGGLSKLIAPAGDEEPVNPDQAFLVEVAATTPQALSAKIVIADCCYLYRDKVNFHLTASDGSAPPADVKLGNITLPPAEVKMDEFIGKTEVYHHGLEVALPIVGRTSSTPDLVLSIGYQGCSEKGVVICYPPMTRKFLLRSSGAVVPMLADGTTASPTPNNAASDGAPLSEQDALAQRLANGNAIATILAFFGLGLLLAFTPCVFPMIPILSGVVVGQGGKISTRFAFFLSLAYVLAMAITYAVVGVLAGLFGANLQVWFQNVWVISAFAAVFVLLSLSLFGFYELQMPSAIQSRLTEMSNRLQGGRVVGAAVMGLLSALIVGPCVTAPLVGALIYIGQTGDAVLGGGALFALGLGMGTPLIIIGTSAGKLLPKAGPWMDTIKAVFGVTMLWVALWLLERVLAGAVTMMLAGGLLLVSGVYMGAFDSITTGVSGWRRLWKGLGLVMALYGAVLLIGAAGGATDVLQPLKGTGVAVSATASQPETLFRRVKGPAGLDQALTEARTQGKPVMLDFYADWCTSCKEMEKDTFSDPAVHAALAGAVVLQTDVTANDDQDQALLKRYKLIGPPAILFFSASGDELSRARVVGYMPAEKFAPHVRSTLARP